MILFDLIGSGKVPSSFNFVFVVIVCVVYLIHCRSIVDFLSPWLKLDQEDEES